MKAQNLRAKQEMNVEFEKNRLKPTDKDFVYDIKVTFISFILVLYFFILFIIYLLG